MKNFILLLGFMLFAGMAMGQFRVSSDGVNHALNSTFIIGEDGGASTAGAFIGQGRSANGRSELSLVSDVDAFSDWGTRIFRSPNGAAGLQHRGNLAFNFQVIDAANIQLRTDNVVRMVIRHTSGDVDVIGNLTANGMSVSSDRRLKSNINEFDKGLDVVMAMRPVSYKYNALTKSSDDRLHVGLIAQELQKIAPEFVGNHNIDEVDDEGNTIKSDTYLKIHDSEVKYILVNALQEQQVMIEELQAQIAELQSTIGSVDQNSTVGDVELIDVAHSTLGQNSPNPYNEGTVISYTVADNATSARMNFYNLTGQLIKSVSLQSGAGKLNVSADELPSGTYTYSLEVDGAMISNKKMVKMR